MNGPKIPGQVIRALAHERLKRLALLREVKAWQRARELQQYIDAAEAAALPTLPQFATEVARQRWITWAKALAAELNPLQNGSAGKAPPPPSLPELPWDYRFSPSGGE